MNNPEHEAGQVTLEPATHLARAAAKLSHRERLRFDKALEILGGGGGAVALARAGMVVRGPGLFEALLARCWAVRCSNSEELFKLAKSAVEVAARLHPRYGARVVADLQARAWGELANAYRIADRNRDAEHAFGKAFTFFCQGSGDRLLKAWLLDLQATLFGCSHEHVLAFGMLVTVRALYEELGEIHLAGRALLSQAVFAYVGGEAGKALRLSQEGMARLDRRREPDLLALAAHNHSIFERALRKAGRPSGDES